MATQHIDFKQPGSTGDTGERDTNAIRPISDEEWAYEAVTRRPSENLRLRTEVLRDAVESLNYLADTAASMVVLGGGLVTWNGTNHADVALRGTFTIQQNMVIKPTLAPALCIPAKVVRDGVVIRTITAVANGVNPPRAYSGANRITVDVVGAAGAALGVTVDGTPADNLHLTVNNDALAGTTRQQLVTFIQASPAFRALGVTAELDVGANGAGVWGSGFNASPTLLKLQGAVDAEQHVITPAGLAAFFSNAANRLQEGDTIGISYDELVMTGSYGGRRQSIAELPEQSELCNDNLFNLRVNPEKGPQAVAIASVVNDQLVFVTGITLNAGQSGPLTLNNSGESITYGGSGNWANGENGVTAPTVTAALTEIVTDLAAAEGAARIGFTPPAGFTATNVQAAIVEAKADAEASASSALTDHTGSESGAHAATAISTTAITGVAGSAASNVQNVLSGLQTNINNHTGAASGAHAASAISTVAIAGVTGTNVQGMLFSLQSNINGKAGTGANTFSGNQTAPDFIATSDGRLKTNVIDFSYRGRLHPKRYEWVKDGRLDIGFIAQEVEVLYPELIHERVEDGEVYKGVSYYKATVILSAQVNLLEERIAALEAKLAQKES